MALRLASVDSTTFLFGNNVLNALLGWFSDKSTLVPVSKYGALGNGTTDDTVALQAAIDSGRALDWGDASKNYRITKTLSRTITSDVYWQSAGATITVDSASPIQRGVYLETAGYNVTIMGRLALDANRKAFVGWYFNSSSPTRAAFYARQLAVRNVYRSGTTFTGGDGIWVRGSYDTVKLDSPDVRNISMAPGAGISGSQGVSGITITSAGAARSVGHIMIDTPYIDGVYSEDAAYQMDQDGIRIFTEEDDGSVYLFDTHFNVRGGQIKNCHGRSIKSQCEFGSIDGTKFIRTTQVAQMSGVASMPEIDFQVGGGLISNVEFRYQSAAPLRAIQWSGTRQVGGKFSTGLSVSGLKMSMTGGGAVSMLSFLSIVMFEQVRAAVNLTNIEIVNLVNGFTTNVVEASGTTSQRLDLRLVNVSAPMVATNAATPAGYVFYRSGAAMPVGLRVVNFTNTRPTSGTVSGSATAGSITANTFGLDGVA